MLSGQDIVCLSTSFWGFRQGSRENIARLFSIRNRILYVDYQINPLHLLMRPHVRDYFLKKPSLEKINSNIFVLRPVMGLPFASYFSTLNSFNQAILLLQLRRILNKLEFREPILWIYNPMLFPLVKELKRKLTVYHCIDNFAAEKSSRMRISLLTKMEENLCQLADIVFAQNDFLIKKLSSYTAKIFLLRPGLSDNFFNEARNLPDKNSNEVVIGFVGCIDDRVDIEILESIASSHPRWRIKLVGPLMCSRKSANRLKRFKNIELTGFVINRLSDIYREFAVGIIPYHINEFTNGVFPIKIFEYFCLGIPVVATALGSIKEFAENNLLYIEKKGGFLKRIEMILSDGEDASLREKRFMLSAENLWSKKMSYIEDLIKKPKENRC